MAGEVVTLKSGNTDITVYRSEFAGTNKATALTFDVDDIDSEVRDLKEKGIFFEHYDVEGLTPKGDIYEGEGMKTAWFKDPDGNILSLFEEQVIDRPTTKKGRRFRRRPFSCRISSRLAPDHVEDPRDQHGRRIDDDRHSHRRNNSGSSHRNR